MAEFNRAWIPAVFSADTELDVGSAVPAQFNSHLHEFSYSRTVQSGCRIGLEYLCLIIIFQNLTGIVSAQSISHLGQVVGTKGEELSLCSNFISCQAGSGNFYHGTYQIFQLNT